ncbi:MAG: 50S ribosomal protein L15, partial [Alphaproteobacteria bacterium]|nr:50S ribosomal protein L15 [Alphaproteobacteria bacterium]
MKLNEIRDNPGARQPRKRVGRGIGSGLGKTSGKGQKGQKSRKGVSIGTFEGGQMPLYRRLPKRGFVNIFRKDVSIINFELIQQAIDRASLSKDVVISAEVLKEAGVIRKNAGIVKLLAKGELKQPLQF